MTCRLNEMSVRSQFVWTNAKRTETCISFSTNAMNEYSVVFYRLYSIVAFHSLADKLFTKICYSKKVASVLTENTPEKLLVHLLAYQMKLKTKNYK